MPAPLPEATWVIRPDVVTSAIKALVWVVGGALGFLSTSLIGTLLYIWNEHKKEMSKISADMKSEVKIISDEFRTEISKVAGSLDTIAKTLFDRQRIVELKMEAQETRCEERHNAPHKRVTDTGVDHGN